MTPLRWKVLPGLAVLACLPAWGWLAGGAAAVAGERTDLLPGAGAPTDVPLEVLREHPARHLGQRVRFVLQLRSVLESWNPGMTRFGSADWVGFSGWADERFVWDPAVHADPATRLFVPRGSALAALLEEARPYERFQVQAVVRECLFDQPWLEVERMTPLYEIVGEGTILHVGRARDFALQGQWDLALDQLRRAGSAPLPAHAREALDKKIVEAGKHAQGVATED